MVIEQREMNFTHKRKLLESQLALVRDQLEVEKRRRLDVQQREARSGGASAGGPAPERHFSRASELHMSRSKSIQRQKSPFRVWAIIMDSGCKEVTTSRGKVVLAEPADVVVALRGRASSRLLLLTCCLLAPCVVCLCFRPSNPSVPSCRVSPTSSRIQLPCSLLIGLSFPVDLIWMLCHDLSAVSCISYDAAKHQLSDPSGHYSNCVLEDFYCSFEMKICQFALFTSHTSHDRLSFAPACVSIPCCPCLLPLVGPK